ncbi:MAG: PEGA domain-containing protein, partial [Bacteroidaceae bacterium]
MNRTFVFALLMAICGLANSQELKFRVAEFYQDQQDLTAQEEARDDGDGSVYAVVKVTSDMEDDDLSKFSFDFNYMKSSREMRDGELWLFVQRNAKNVTIRRDGYKTVKYALTETIKAGKTYRMLLSVQAPKVVQRVLQFKVTPANEGAIVRVKPEDSTDDYQLWGTVDTQGCIDRLLQTGAYLYEVSANNYRTAQGKVNLMNGEGNHVEDVRLVPNFGFLEIADAGGIAGAEVYVDNRKVGTIPYKSDRMECRDGYRLMVSNGELYKTYNSTFAIRQGETTKITPRLESNFAETTIKVDGEAEIFVNGVSKGKGSWTGPLRAGTYDVECRLPNHTSSQLQIEVKADVVETFVVDKPRPIEGTLYVKSNPSGAQIYLDGKNLSITTPAKLDHVLIGEHQVTVMLPNHKTENKSVDIRRDETVTVDVTLSNVARMTIDSNPTGADLYIDGEHKGTTPYTEEMPSGEYDIKLIKKKYSTFNRRVSLDSSNPEQTFNLKRQYQRKYQGYFQPTFQFGSYTGVGASLGCYLANFNIEADFLYGLSPESICMYKNNGVAW